MTTWERRSENGCIANLARKARRRGDAKEAAAWYRAINLRQHADERYNLAIERRWRFNHTLQSLRDIDEELERLRKYVAWNPQAQDAAKADNYKRTAPSKVE